MAYDEPLAERVREQLCRGQRVTERRMFGGLAFLLDGSMVVAVGADGVMVRVHPGLRDELLDGAGVTSVVMRGRELRGWLRVASTAMPSDAALATWLDRAAASIGTSRGTA